MRILHRVALNPSDEQRRALTEHGIEYQDRGHGMIVCLVEEEHPTWPALASFVAEWRAVDLVITEFSKKELADADYLEMVPAWHHRYPQPEDDFAYRGITYDNTEYCSECGIGLEQQAPFRMSREPKWGTKQILQLNWVFDEFFVTPEAWRTVFKSFDVDSLPVRHHKSGHSLMTVLQLQASAWTASRFEPEGYIPVECPKCARVKLTNGFRGRFPHVELPANVHMARTPEYFGPGDGPVAYHAVIISGALYDAIASHKLKGATFKVVAARGQARI